MENHFFCQNISAAFAGKFYQTFEHTTAAWNDTQLLFSASLSPALRLHRFLYFAKMETAVFLPRSFGKMIGAISP